MAGEQRGGGRGRISARLVGAGFAVVAVIGGLAAVRLAHLERTGPPHVDVTIGDGIPATVYVPGPVDRDFQQLPDPRPRGARPPVVVLAHGFAVDRPIMSALARSLTEHGYAVVSFDWRGHGSNRNAFHSGNEELRDDLTAVVDWTETFPWVDGERLVVMGHSMGARGVLDFATRDARPRAVVPVSGSAPVTGPAHPRNVLFIVAEDDPSRIHEGIDHAYEQLTGDAPAARPARSGNPARGSGVSVVEIGGRDHATVLFADETVNAAVAWMDATFGIERSATRGIVDPRLRVAALYFLALLVLLAGLGRVAGRLAPDADRREDTGSWRGLVVLLAALVVVSPLVAGSAPAGFVELRAGESVASLLVLAGAVVLVARLGVRRGLVPSAASRWLGPGLEMPHLRSALAPAAMVAAAVYVLTMPLSPVFHRLAPTPERLVLVPVVAALAVPFTVAFHTLLRRGGGLRATLWSIAGRVLVLAFLLVGAGVGLLPSVLQVIVPVLALLFVMFEIVTAAIYVQGRSLAVAALAEALLLGWIIATTLPLGLGPVA